MQVKHVSLQQTKMGVGQNLHARVASAIWCVTILHRLEKEPIVLILPPKTVVGQFDSLDLKMFALLILLSLGAEDPFGSEAPPPTANG